MPFEPQTFNPALWGLAVLASFIGWGEVVRRALRISPRQANIGLTAGWGMALVLAVGGFLQLVRLSNWLALEILTGVGIACLIVSWMLKRPRPLSLNRMAPYLPAAGLLAVVYVLSAKANYLNHWDDYPAYLVYAKDMLAHGIIDQPFSLRRLLTFGGQQQLDAILLLNASERNIDLLEQGICRIIFVALVAGLVRPRGTKQRIAAAIFLAALVFVPREHLPIENIHSEMTGLVLFLTLLRTLLLAVDRNSRQMLGLAAVAAMVGAAASSLRVSYLPAAVLMIAFYYLGRMVFDRARARSHGVQLLLAAGVFAVILLPWSLVLYQTSGTLLNPLWLGTQRPEYNFLSSNLSAMKKLAWVTGFALQPMNDRTPMGMVMCLPLLMAFSRRHRRTELPLALAAVVTGIMILLTFTFAWYDTIYRYIFPIMFGLSVALLYRAVLRPIAWRSGGSLHAFVSLFVRPASVYGLFVGVCLFLLAVFHVPAGLAWVVVTRQHIPEPQPGVAEWRIGIERMEAELPHYLAAQQAIPEKQRIFVAASFPSHFDFGRNRILIADIPGAASPAPGMPLLQGAEAVKEYLLARNIRYVIFSDDTIQNMYSRPFWYDVRDRKGNITPDIINVSPFNLAFLDVRDAFARQEKVLYRQHSLVVIELQP